MSAITCAKSLALSALSSGVEGRVLPWLRLGRRDGRQIPRYAQLAPNWRRQRPRDGFEHEVWLIATKKPSRGRPASRGVGLAKHSNLAFSPPDAQRRQAAVAKRHRSRPQTPPSASRRCYRRSPAPWRGTQGATGALATGTEAGDAAEVVRCWWAERLAPAGRGVMRSMGHDRPVALSCSRCGTTWETTSEEMARKTPKCPTCSGAKKPAKAKKLTPKERRAAKAEAFAAKVLERSCGALVVDVGSYSTSTAKVAAACSACGHRWSTRSDHLLSRHWCPKCGAGR